MTTVVSIAADEAGHRLLALERHADEAFGWPGAARRGTPFTDQFLRVQRVYKYKYEVISAGSEFFGLVDIAFSDHLLRAGHHYEVVFNDESENPRILEVMQELER